MENISIYNAFQKKKKKEGRKELKRPLAIEYINSIRIGKGQTLTNRKDRRERDRTKDYNDKKV